MRIVVTIGLLLFGIIPQEQSAVIVYSNVCIVETVLPVTKAVRVEIPIVNGEPDTKHGVIYGIQATLKKDCGFIEVRHK